MLIAWLINLTTYVCTNHLWHVFMITIDNDNDWENKSAVLKDEEEGSMKTRQYIIYHPCINILVFVFVYCDGRNMSYVLLHIRIKCIVRVLGNTCTLRLMITLMVITNTEHIHFTVVIGTSLVIFLFCAMYIYNIYLYWTKSSFGVGYNTNNTTSSYSGVIY